MRFKSRIAAGWAILAAAAIGAKGAEPAALRADPEIIKMVASVSSERIQRSIFVLVSFKTRHTLSDPLPSGDGIGGASAWIRAEFERASKAARGRLQVDFDTFRQPAQPPLIPRATELTNVVAKLPGPGQRIYLITAHYDSRAQDLLDAQSPAPGANDNAAGVATVLEAARDLAPYDFNATLVFLITTGGEQGGAGAAHWAEEARRQGLDLAGVIDVDAIGRTRSLGGADRRGLWLFAQGVPAPADQTGSVRGLIEAGGENDTPPRALARAIRAAVLLYVPAIDLHLVYRPAGNRAHGGPLPFLSRGFSAVGLTTVGGSDEAPDDTPNAIEFAHVAEVARVNTATLAALARAPAPPRNVTWGLTPKGTQLQWAASSDALSYRVVWRETNAAFWEHALEAPRGANESLILGVTPADTLFGVQAFDSAGHISPVTFALPASRP